MSRMQSAGTVYLNGDFLPADEAVVSVSDRGFLLSDGVYEVTPAYRGRFFRSERHLARMARGLAELRIGFDVSAVPGMQRALLEKNGLGEEEVATVYVQVTRGVAPRSHAFPAGETEPTVYAFAAPFHRPSRERWDEGFGAVTVPDRRWARVDIKSIALLPNVLAQQAAAEAGAADAIFVRDGVALEGAHNNLFFVFGGAVVTHPASHQILHGITREYVLELAGRMGIPVEERAVQVEEMEVADEVFFTGSTTEVRPCVEVDGWPVADGRPGPVTRRLYDAFLADVGRDSGE